MKAIEVFEKYYPEKTKKIQNTFPAFLETAREVEGKRLHPKTMGIAFIDSELTVGFQVGEPFMCTYARRLGIVKAFLKNL